MVRYSACGQTVGDLIEDLKKCNQSAIVKIFDPDEEEWLPVTGFTLDEEEVKLYSDED
ncbi:MAG: hypothetical protein WCS55_04695 [Sulfuricurvum sp.]|uniref:hypothetical protein n=1 Tax=Sulfuricurvum sp. TaxID=2025608 RepID=UPI00356527A7